MTNEMMYYRHSLGLITKVMKNGSGKDFFLLTINIYIIMLTTEKFLMIHSPNDSQLIT